MTSDVFKSKQSESTDLDCMWRGAVFLVINVSHPLLIDFLRRQGGIAAMTGGHILPIYLGMMCVYMLPHPKDKPLSEEKWSLALIIGFLDLLHQIFEKVGLVYTGSAVYILISSSGVVSTALLSYLVLKQRMNFWMSVGTWLTFMGLVLKGWTIKMSLQDTEFFGIMLTSIGVILQSATYVMSEKFLTDKDSFSGPNFVFIHGVFNSVILGVWFLFTAGVPGMSSWEKHFTIPIKEHGGAPMTVFIGYLMIFIAAVIRSSILWFLQKHSGAMAINILKGARTAVGIFLSHYLYCALESTQCLTPIKFAAAACCICGCFIFGYGKRLMNKLKK